MLYVLALIGITLWSLVFLVGGIMQGGTAAIFALIFAPLGFILGLVYARVLLEFIAIVFRIAEHTSIIAANTSGAAPAATSPAPPAQEAWGAAQPPPPAPEGRDAGQAPPPPPAQGGWSIGQTPRPGSTDTS